MSPPTCFSFWVTAFLGFFSSSNAANMSPPPITSSSFSFCSFTFSCACDKTCGLSVFSTTFCIFCVSFMIFPTSPLSLPVIFLHKDLHLSVIHRMAARSAFLTFVKASFNPSSAIISFITLSSKFMMNDSIAKSYCVFIMNYLLLTLIIL